MIQRNQFRRTVTVRKNERKECDGGREGGRGIQRHGIMRGMVARSVGLTTMKLDTPPSSHRTCVSTNGRGSKPACSGENCKGDERALLVLAFIPTSRHVAGV